MTYISDLRLQLRPFKKCSFKPSYLLGLNELVGLAYVQNLGLLMKRAPGDVGLLLYHKSTLINPIFPGKKQNTCMSFIFYFAIFVQPYYDVLLLFLYM